MSKPQLSKSRSRNEVSWDIENTDIIPIPSTLTPAHSLTSINEDAEHQLQTENIEQYADDYISDSDSDSSFGDVDFKRGNSCVLPPMFVKSFSSVQDLSQPVHQINPSLNKLENTTFQSSSTDLDEIENLTKSVPQFNIISPQQRTTSDTLHSQIPTENENSLDTSTKLSQKLEDVLQNSLLPQGSEKNVDTTFSALLLCQPSQTSVYNNNSSAGPSRAHPTNKNEQNAYPSASYREHQNHQATDIESDNQEPDPPILHLRKKPKKTLSPAEQQVYVDGSGTEVHNFVVDRTIKSATNRRLTACCIFAIEESVQVFYISPDGSVQVPDYTSSLKFVRLHRNTPDEATTQNQAEDENSPLQPVAFLHVGNWLYPLIPGYSPALITAYGTYVFPDLRSKQQGAAVALALPQFLPLDEREQFEVLLEYYANVEDAVDRVGMGDVVVDATRSRSVCESIGSLIWDADDIEGRRLGVSNMSVSDLASTRGIVAIIRIISVVLVLTIEKFAQLGVWIIQLIASTIRAVASRSPDNREVDPYIMRSVLYAKEASENTVLLTGQIVENLHDAALNIGTLVAPPPSLFLPDFLFGKDTFLGAAFQLTAIISFNAYGGLGEVYTSLGDASNMLFDALSEETAKTVEHRYGDHYGDLTREAFGAAHNLKQLVTHTQVITTLAFVPMTIETRVKQKIHPNRLLSLAVDSEEYRAELMAIYHGKALGAELDEEIDEQDEIDEEEREQRRKERRKKRKKRKAKKLAEELGKSTIETMSQESTKSPPKASKLSTLKKSLSAPSTIKNKFSGWWNSTKADPKTLQSKATRKESISPHEWLRNKFSNGIFKNPGTESPSGSQERVVAASSSNAVRGINPIAEVSSSNSLEQAESLSSIETVSSGNLSPESTSVVNYSSGASLRTSKSKDVRIVEPVSSRTSDGRFRSQSIARRKSSTAGVAQTRRQSVFLSTRRQSLHVMTAMASVLERQMTPSMLGLSTDVNPPLWRSKFQTAAVSITKSKIRRMHREMSLENHLVVIQRSETMLRQSQSQSAPDLTT